MLRPIKNLVRRGLVAYVDFADKRISAHLGGDQSPAFFDIDETFPALREIDRHYDRIAQEVHRLVRQPDSPAQIHDTFPSHPPVPGWRVLYVYVHGMPNLDLPGKQFFPETVRVLEGIPNLLGGWFSILEPKKSIKAHRGRYRGFLRYHIAFKVPTDAPPKLRVKDEFYEWKERESVLFDDRHEHEVYNESADYRVVLIVDVMRPLPWPLHLLNLIAVKSLSLIVAKPTAGFEKDLWDG